MGTISRWTLVLIGSAALADACTSKEQDRSPSGSLSPAATPLPPRSYGSGPPGANGGPPPSPLPSPSQSASPPPAASGLPSAPDTGIADSSVPFDPDASAQWAADATAIDLDAAFPFADASAAAGDACHPKNAAQICVAFYGEKPRCGQHSDECGGNLECGACSDTKQVCFQGSCCSPGSTCKQGDKARCGGTDDGCGGTWDCGACAASGDVCDQGVCCTPKPVCTNGGKQICASVSDGCGRQFDCGTCKTSGDVCYQGLCCTPSPVCTGSGTQLCGKQPDGCGGTGDCPACSFGDCNGGRCSCAVDTTHQAECSSGRPVTCPGGGLPASGCSPGKSTDVWCCP